MRQKRRRSRWRPLRWGVPALTILYAVSAFVSVPRIEADRSEQVRRTLADKGFSALTVSFAGRDATVSGTGALDDVTADVVRDLAIQWGVRQVRLVALNPSSETTGIDVTAAVGGGKLRLSGRAPNATLRAQLVAAAAEAVGTANVVDELAIVSSESTATPVELAQRAIGAADLTQFEQMLPLVFDSLEAGGIALRGRTVDVSGSLKPATNVDGLRADLSAAAASSPGLQVRDSLSGGAAVSQPATLAGGQPTVTAEVANSRVVLRGSVQTEPQRRTLLDSAAASFGANNVVDELTLVKSVTSSGDAAVAALDSLLRSSNPDLNAGRLMLGQSRLVIEGVAVDASAIARLDTALAKVSAAGLTTSTRLSLRSPDPVSASGSTPASPQVQTAVAEVNRLVVLKPVLFKSDSSEILAESLPTLDAIATVFRPLANASIVVEGHTDAQGDEQANQSLSELRALAVRAALVSRGVPPAGLTALGFGESRPVADNSTEAGRHTNRRVQFSLKT